MPNDTPTTYMPSSGTEGADFMAQWCDRCTEDWDYQHDKGDSCLIIVGSMCGDQQPEWVEDEHGRPRCTAFVKHPDAPEGVSPLQAELVTTPTPDPAEVEAARYVGHGIERWKLVERIANSERDNDPYSAEVYRQFLATFDDAAHLTDRIAALEEGVPRVYSEGWTAGLQRAQAIAALEAEKCELLKSLDYEESQVRSLTLQLAASPTPYVLTYASATSTPLEAEKLIAAKGGDL